jgi:predicted dehydrogenase
MKSALTRRAFLKRSALGAGTYAATRFFPAVDLLAAPPSRRLNCVQIGCGGRGLDHLQYVTLTAKENLVAIVDADEKRHAAVTAWLAKNKVPADNLKFFTDYRRMFDLLGAQIDAVFIATPNHHHALPAQLAMQRNIAVFCEKPLCHTVAEARALSAAAAQSKSPAQMGNQGHCEDGYRRLCEFIDAGVVGKITETHSWTDRANGGTGPRPKTQAPPPGINWESWIGPAPFREFHDDLHPHEWHGWYDFGNGSLGNMGCHVLDGVFWALKVQHPTAIEMEEVREGTDERYPTGCRLRFDIPAREGLPALKAYWYDGLKRDVTNAAIGENRTALGGSRNQPPLLETLRKQYPDEEFDNSGTIYVGEKGILYTGTYGQRMHILPLEKMEQLQQPPRTLPRPKNVMTDFLNAVHEGQKETATPFSYGARLTEFTMLGNLAQKAGVGTKVEWDGAAMRVKSPANLNDWVRRPSRPGWTA